MKDILHQQLYEDSTTLITILLIIVIRIIYKYKLKLVFKDRKLYKNEKQEEYHTKFKKVCDQYYKQSDEYSLTQVEKFKKNKEFLNIMIENKLIHSDYIVKDMDKLFYAHYQSMKYLDPSVIFQMSVHYNLFLGSIQFLGTQKHLNKIKLNNVDELGCFAMTESIAGVYSGSVINTNAQYNQDDNTFTINSIDSKNWISLGYQSKYAVIFANLHINNTNHGPHPFLIDFNKHKNYKRELMQNKSIVNGLDNAKIMFNNTVIEYDYLLDYYSYIENGKYKIRNCKKFNIIKVAMRLLCGRVCIGYTALSAMRATQEDTLKYCSEKEISLYFDKRTKTTVKDKMINLPQIKKIMEELYEEIQYLERYINYVIEEYKINCRDVDTELLLHICICKSQSCQKYVYQCHKIKELCGTYTLFQNSFVGKLFDSHQSLLVVEGDVAVLQQLIVKIVLDKYIYRPQLFIFDIFRSRRIYLYKLFKLLIKCMFSRNKSAEFSRQNILVREIAELQSICEIRDKYRYAKE